MVQLSCQFQFHFQGCNSTASCLWQGYATQTDILVGSSINYKLNWQGTVVHCLQGIVVPSAQAAYTPKGVP